MKGAIYSKYKILFFHLTYINIIIMIFVDFSGPLNANHMFTSLCAPLLLYLTELYFLYMQPDLKCVYLMQCSWAKIERKRLRDLS